TDLETVMGERAAKLAMLVDEHADGVFGAAQKLLDDHGFAWGRGKLCRACNDLDAAAGAAAGGLEEGRPADFRRGCTVYLVGKGPWGRHAGPLQGLDGAEL